MSGDPTLRIRAALTEARELAGLGMAHHYLAEARSAILQLATRDIKTAELLILELEEASAIVRQAEQTEQTAPTAPDIGAQMSPDQMGVEELRRRVTKVEELIADGKAGPPHLTMIRALRDRLVDLADSDELNDVEWDRLKLALDYAEEQLSAVPVRGAA